MLKFWPKMLILHIFHSLKKPKSTFLVKFSVEKLDSYYLPQIFKGASNSNRMGCCKKISRDFRHRPRTSFSVIWTVLPGRLPRTTIFWKKIKINKFEFFSRENEICSIRLSNRHRWWLNEDIFTIADDDEEKPFTNFVKNWPSSNLWMRLSMLISPSAMI